MKFRLVLAAASLPTLAMGCMTERIYDGPLDMGVIAELSGSVGQVNGINQQYRGADSSSPLFGNREVATVDRYGDELFASMVASNDFGRAYINVSVYDFERMVPGERYTATVDSGYVQEGGFTYEVEGEPARADGPSISVYACPELNDGRSAGTSGYAREVDVVLQETPAGRPVLTFEATADDPGQDLFLDGWLLTR
jgi:hypothetical protein